MADYFWFRIFSKNCFCDFDFSKCARTINFLGAFFFELRNTGKSLSLMFSIWAISYGFKILWAGEPFRKRVPPEQFLLSFLKYAIETVYFALAALVAAIAPIIFIIPLAISSSIFCHSGNFFASSKLRWLMSFDRSYLRHIISQKLALNFRGSQNDPKLLVFSRAGDLRWQFISQAYCKW